jgi:hypothetical protein
MRVYIFLSDNGTHGECIRKGVFGSGKTEHLQVKVDDYCVLIHRDEKRCYGIFKQEQSTNDRERQNG